jgi:hypothetical protein
MTNLDYWEHKKVHPTIATASLVHRQVCDLAMSGSRET